MISNNVDNELYSKIKQRELEHQDSYQIVTAQNSTLLAYQIIAKEFYKQKHGIETLSKYKFLRYPNPFLPKDIPTFLSTMPQFFTDHMPSVRNQLVACSYSIEQKPPSPALETAREFYEKGSGISDQDIYPLISQIFISEGIDPEDHKEIAHDLIAAAPRSTRGIVVQIFFDKDYPLDTVLYAAHNNGLSCQCYHGKYTSVKQIFDAYKNGEPFRCSDEFYNWAIYKQKFYSTQIPQLRFLANSLNPETHNPQLVKLYRYTTISKEVMRAYKQLVKEKVALILHKHSLCRK